MQKIIILAIVAIICLGAKSLFSAPVGNPLKEPDRGDLMIGYEWTLVDKQYLKNNDYATAQEYQSDLHMAKFTYGVLDGLTVNGEIGVGRIKNIDQSVPHTHQLAWGGGFSWNVLENLHSLFSIIPEKLPYDIDFGFSGRYIGIESDRDNPTPQTLSTSSYYYDESLKEFQVALWIARDFGLFIPYAALITDWTQVRQKEDINSTITTRTLKDPADFGYAIGFDLCPGKCEKLSQIRFLKDINLTFEFRGESETALTAGINWLWKY